MNVDFINGTVWLEKPISGLDVMDEEIRSASQSSNNVVIQDGILVSVEIHQAGSMKEVDDLYPYF